MLPQATGDGPIQCCSQAPPPPCPCDMVGGRCSRVGCAALGPTNHPGTSAHSIRSQRRGGELSFHSRKEGGCGKREMTAVPVPCRQTRSYVSVCMNMTRRQPLDPLLGQEAQYRVWMSLRVRINSLSLEGGRLRGTFVRPQRPNSYRRFHMYPKPAESCGTERTGFRTQLAQARIRSLSSDRVRTASRDTLARF